jgi:putative ABC transport system substrate-binding protein
VNVRNCASLCSVWAVLWLTLFGVSLPAQSQQAARIYRLGFVTPYPLPPGDDDETKAAYVAFERALQDRGYIRGKNLALTYRSSGGRDELLPSLVADLLRDNVDILLTLGTPATLAAQRATKTTPIVMVTVLDPVHSGFVASLSHPGSNITGSSELSEELAAKRLELLKEGMTCPL